MENTSNERGPFCGFKCYGIWQKNNTTSDKNPNYVENSNARYAGIWYRNRDLAKERDNHQCVDCGSKKKLHVHHKEHWKKGQHDPHRLDNLVTLCSTCHRKYHVLDIDEKGKFIKIKG